MGQNNQRGFFGIIIQAEILDDGRLSLTDKVVFAYIASYSKYCADSNAKIAERLGIGARSVIRSVQNLQKLGLVEVRFGTHSLRKIYNTFTQKMADSACGKPVEKSVQKSVENSKGCANLAGGCAKLATQKTGKGVPNWHTKNIRINKNNSSRDDIFRKNTSAGLAGKGPASRLNMEDALTKLSTRLSLGAH